MLSVKLDGAEALLANLKTLPDRAANKVLRQSLRAGAKIVLASAKQKVPRRSGTLADKLRVRAGRRKRGRIGMVVSTVAGDYMGKAFYAPFVEFGHHLGKRKYRVRTDRTGRRGNQRRRVGMDARPWQEGGHQIRAAYEATRENVIKTVMDTMRKGIEREAASVAAADSLRMRTVGA